MNCRYPRPVRACRRSIPTATFETQVEDTDGDGRIDLIATDADGDGEVDAVVDLHSGAVDYDGDADLARGQPS